MSKIRSAIMLVVLVTMVVTGTHALAGQPSPAGVELFTPAVVIGSNFGYFVCLVTNVGVSERHGTVEFFNASDPAGVALLSEPVGVGGLGDNSGTWALPPDGVKHFIRQLNDPEMFHAMACHVTSTDARSGDLLITHCGANSGLQCQSTVTAQ
jgi:hypothetical protein